MNDRNMKQYFVRNTLRGSPQIKVSLIVCVGNILTETDNHQVAGRVSPAPCPRGSLLLNIWEKQYLSVLHQKDSYLSCLMWSLRFKWRQNQIKSFPPRSALHWQGLLYLVRDIDHVERVETSLPSPLHTPPTLCPYLSGHTRNEVWGHSGQAKMKLWTRV